MNASSPYNDTIDLSWEGSSSNSSLCINNSLTLNNSSIQEKNASKFSVSKNRNRWQNAN